MPQLTSQAAPTPIPTPTPPPLVQAIASVSSNSTTGGHWYCLDLCGLEDVAQIAVSNPNPYPVSAAVEITFTSGGQAADSQSQTVQLASNGTSTISATSSQTSDSATVQVSETVPTGGSTGGGYGSTAGYGSVPSYGSTGGASYGSTSPSYGSTGGTPY